MKKKVFLGLKIFFGILMIIGINGLFMWHNDKKDIEEINEYVDHYFYEEENGKFSLEEGINYYNDETIGWLRIDGTRINYPVVQAINNTYYLKHDFNKKRNSAGWIFMDSDNKLTDQNIVIYGHHRKDGIMFGDVDKLMKKKFYDKNDGKILLVINDENIYYQIFSVYKAKSNDDYANSNYDNFEEKLKEFKSKSTIKFDSNLNDVEQIITLSTCHNNNKDRLVVHAYRILS